MAKRAHKVQDNVADVTMPMGPEGNVLVDGDLNEVVELGLPQPEVDASGRKKKVDISMEELEQKGLKTKSQAIRYLDDQGYNRSAIAHFLNIRYQHVRNVLVTPMKRQS